jgi:hypothetical protein
MGNNVIRMLHQRHYTAEQANALLHEVRATVRRLQDATLGFEHLEALDLLVRDLEAGLIDFPSLRDGREVYLCWQVEEQEVGHWHAAETGYPSRLPLDPWH